PLGLRFPARAGGAGSEASGIFASLDVPASEGSAMSARASGGATSGMVGPKRLAAARESDCARTTARRLSRSAGAWPIRPVPLRWAGAESVGRERSSLAIGERSGHRLPVLPVALLWDLDGTLFDSEAFDAEGVARTRGDGG